MRTWATPTIEYGIFNGFNVSSRGVGVWQLPDGDFSYVDVQVQANTTNRLCLYKWRA